MEDLELLQEYVKQGSEKAFATIVSRHIDLVYAAAYRRLGDKHLAEEVTQTVFIILARKAPRIGHGILLAPWLFRTARYAASDVLKSEYRRQQRERQAIALALSDTEPESVWNNLEPRLDSALARLTERACAKSERPWASTKMPPGNGWLERWPNFAFF
jgi:RNA polymerase sigma factor (sigma-70 family)